jgi:hypothetical protein
VRKTHFSVLGFVVVVCMLVASLASVIWWFYDVHQDRKHIVIVESQTLMFAGSGNRACQGQRLTDVHTVGVLPVRRIRYWKNCATIDVTLPDGRDGYIVLGEGDVTVSPRLPRI